MIETKQPTDMRKKEKKVEESERLSDPLDIDLS